MNSSSENPYQPTPESPEGKPGQTKLFSFSPAEIVVLMVIVVVLIALLLPAVQQPRSSCRPPCKNNLKQIGLALHHYHDVYSSFPPAVVIDGSGHPAHSWRVLILPFLDEHELYDQYRFDEPWNSPHNLTLQDQMPACFRCGEFLKDVDKDSLEYQHLNRLSNYAAIVSQQAVFDVADPRRLMEVKDGTSRTIMVAEVRQHAVHWMSPEDVTPSQLLTDLRRCATEEHSNHRRGLHVGFVDGSVRWIPHELDESILHALITIAGGEPLPTDL